MKSIIKRLLLITAAALALGGCGGGDSTTTTYTPPTPPPTPTQSISLVPFKAVYGGTATAGTQYSFNLSGTDKNGKVYTATYSLASKGATVFEGQNVNWTQEKFSLSTGGQAVVQETGDIYWTTPIDRLYKILINGSGIVVGCPVLHLSDSIESNFITTIAGSGVPYSINGATVTPTTSKTYDNTSSGSANLILASQYAAHIAAIGFYVTPAGSPYKMELVFNYNGAEITLNSN